ncbi:MAG: DnaB-like helicase C-terminal domain-containing protein [Opitutales bacterium]|nr:DnaB-like helicase C-terminal domain-containing protein [Opitutales bacterium]
MTPEQNFNRRGIEQEIIAWLVRDFATSPESHKALSELKEVDFSDDVFRRAFLQIRKFATEGVCFNARMIQEATNGHVPMAEISPESLNLGSGLSDLHLPPLVEMLKKIVQREKLESAVKSFSEQLKADKDVPEIVASLQTRLNDISTGAKPFARSAKKAWLEQIAMLEAMRAGTYVEPPRLSLGVPAIDEALNGGIANGQLAILAARPACGKTSFAAHAVANALRSGKKVLFASLEMTDGEIIRKLTENLVGFFVPQNLTLWNMFESSWNELKLKGFSPDDVFDPDAFGDFASRLRFVDNAPHAEFFQKVRLEFMRERFDVFVLDYAQIVQGLPGECFRETVSKVSVGLKTLARELEIPVLALAQLNRDSSKESRKPRMTDIKESGSLEQDADVVFLLSDDSDPNAQDVKHASKLTRLVEIAKNRHGGTGCFKLSFDALTSRFTERNDSDA